MFKVSQAWSQIENVDRLLRGISVFSVLLLLLRHCSMTERHPSVYATAAEKRRKRCPFQCEGEKRLSIPFSASHPIQFPPITGTGFITKPVWGAKAEKGRRSRMEDTFAFKEDFLELKGYQDALENRYPDCMLDEDIDSLQGDSPNYNQIKGMHHREVFHFYAVYDGHGGKDASDHCAARMHENIQTAWNNLLGSRTLSSYYSSDEDDCMNFRSYIQDRVTSDDVVKLIQEGYRMTDDEFEESSSNAAIMGSTAVTACVGDDHLLIGYCGDSRAVLCRNGRAIPLTVDHKPEREDETERVQDAGGQVLFFNGPRVMGLLAMSRAIGDRSLRPYVIPTPDVCIVERKPEDQVLILATDGLWDVLSNQEACALAIKCLNRAKEKGALPGPAAKLTATVLTRAAIDRGSRDNITVLVIDLRHGDMVQSVSSSENDSPHNTDDLGETPAT